MKTIYYDVINRDHIYTLEASTRQGIEWALTYCGWDSRYTAVFEPGEKELAVELHRGKGMLPPLYLDATKRPWFLVEPASKERRGRMLFDTQAAFAATRSWKLHSASEQVSTGALDSVEWPDPFVSAEPFLTITCQHGFLSQTITAPLSCCERLDAAPLVVQPLPGELLVARMVQANAAAIESMRAWHAQDVSHLSGCYPTSCVIAQAIQTLQFVVDSVPSSQKRAAVDTPKPGPVDEAL